MFANLVYLLALAVLSPLVLYRAVRFGRYRRGIGEKLWGLSPARAAQLRSGDDRPLVWIHAVSVGEVNLLPGVVRQLTAEVPAARVAISASTDTGYDVAVRHFGPEQVFFCPLDFSWAVRRTLDRLRPDALVLAELELWPNLIRLAATRGCPVLVINARLSERSARGYRRFAAVTGSIFRRLTWVGCQDATVAERFIECGAAPDRVTVTGSLKFDNAPSSRDTAEVASRYNWAGVDPWHRVWCFGSTQPGEEAIGLRVYSELRGSHPELRLMLVPRHPERFDAVAKLISEAGFRTIRRSRGDSQYADLWEADEVILVDTVGELRHWWGVCQIATVGGSFGDRGGQNMLEPAGYGCAVSFGPDTRNFQEIASRLLDVGGAARVVDEAALQAFVARCLDDRPAADSLGRAARKLIRDHRGATERSVAAIKQHLDSPRQQIRSAASRSSLSKRAGEAMSLVRG